MATYVTDRVIQPWRTMNINTVDKRAFVGDKINAPTGIGSFTISLPEGTLSQNDQVIIRDPRTDASKIGDVGNGWATNNLTVSAAQLINGYSDTLICNIQGASLTFAWWNVSPVGWRMYVS